MLEEEAGPQRYGSHISAESKNEPTSQSGDIMNNTRYENACHPQGADASQQDQQWEQVGDEDSTVKENLQQRRKFERRQQIQHKLRQGITGNGDDAVWRQTGVYHGGNDNANGHGGSGGGGIGMGVNRLHNMQNRGGAFLDLREEQNMYGASGHNQAKPEQEPIVMNNGGGSFGHDIMSRVDAMNDADMNSMYFQDQTIGVANMQGNEKEPSAGSSGQHAQNNMPRGAESMQYSGPETSLSNKISVQLTHKLARSWEVFERSNLICEMIIGKGGRRPNPRLAFDCEGLDPEKSYSIFVKVVPINKCRWKYSHETQGWIEDKKRVVPPQKQYSCHPQSPQLGKTWMEGPVKFNNLKLTLAKSADNSAAEDNDTILMTANFLYVPIIVVVDQETRMEVFERQFLECRFFTVSAYKNPQVKFTKQEGKAAASLQAFNNGGANNRLRDLNDVMSDDGSTSTYSTASSSYSQASSVYSKYSVASSSSSHRGQYPNIFSDMRSMQFRQMMNEGDARIQEGLEVPTGRPEWCHRLLPDSMPGDRGMQFENGPRHQAMNNNEINDYLGREQLGSMQIAEGNHDNERMEDEGQGVGRHLATWQQQPVPHAQQQSQRVKVVVSLVYEQSDGDVRINAILNECCEDLGYRFVPVQVMSLHEFQQIPSPDMLVIGDDMRLSTIAKWIVSSPALQNTHVVGVTSDPKALDVMVECGAVDIINPPLDFYDVRNRLMILLGLQ